MKLIVGGFVAMLAILPLVTFAQRSSCPQLTRNLYLGSRGPDVIQLQNFLISQKDLATGNNSGYFGKLTETAVKSFQKRNSVVSSGSPATTGYGSVGARTRAAILKICSKTATSLPAYAQSVYGGGYSQSTYGGSYSQGNYYAQGSYGASYSQGTYGTSYSQGSYYSQGTYYSQGSYAPTQAPAPTLHNTFSLTASWAGNILGTSLYALPIGWGYMDPQVIVSGNDFYVPTLSPCDDTTRHVYCLYVLKNGTEFVTQDLHVLGTGGGDTATYAYQTPSLFLYYNTLIIVYWYSDQNGASTIAIDGINMNLPTAERAWVRLGTYKPPNESINYLGAGMARDGTIYIAGFGVSEGLYALELIRSLPSYATMEKMTPFSYTTKAHQPLYPHVVVKNDGKIAVLFNLENGLNCPADNASWTSYKANYQYEGYWGQSFEYVWQDLPSDSIASPTTNGSNCNITESRFPLDLIYSPSDNSTYALERVQDTAGAEPTAQARTNKEWTQKFAVWKNGTKLNSDVSAAFAPVFATSKDINAMSFTQLSDGTFIIFANSRYTLGSFAAVSTKDFQTFSVPLEIPTQYGAGHSIKVGQGYKNTMDGVDRAIFYHSGRFNDSWLSLPNYHLQFSGGEVKT